MNYMKQIKKQSLNRSSGRKSNIVICTKVTESNMSQMSIFHGKLFAFTILLVAIHAKKFPLINVENVDIIKQGMTNLAKGVGGKCNEY